VEISSPYGDGKNNYDDDDDNNNNNNTINIY
jgi:hypothetical protein